MKLILICGLGISLALAVRVGPVHAQNRWTPQQIQRERERQAALQRARQAALEQQRKAVLEQQRKAALEQQKKATLEQQKKAALEQQKKAALEQQKKAALAKQKQNAARSTQQPVAGKTQPKPLTSIPANRSTDLKKLQERAKTNKELAAVQDKIRSKRPLTQADLAVLKNNQLTNVRYGQGLNLSADVVKTLNQHKNDKLFSPAQKAAIQAAIDGKSLTPAQVEALRTAARNPGLTKQRSYPFIQAANAAVAQDKQANFQNNLLSALSGLGGQPVPSGSVVAVGAMPGGMLGSGLVGTGAIGSTSDGLLPPPIPVAWFSTTPQDTIGDSLMPQGSGIAATILPAPAFTSTAAASGSRAASPPAEKVRVTRYLQLANATDKPITVHLMYKTITTAGDQRWFPGVPGSGVRSLRVQLTPGEVADLTHENWRIHASAARIWAESADQSWHTFKNKSFPLVPENKGYSDQATQVVNVTFR